jgi:thiamine biosynthesis lipoprotein
MKRLFQQNPAKIWFILTVLIGLTACSSSPSWHQTTVVYFDTLCEIRLYCSDKMLKQALEEIHQVFTTIENNFGPEAESLASPLTLGLYRKAYEVYLHSDGAFDLTVAPLSRLWGFLNGQPHLPSSREIKKILPLIGMDKIKIENNRLFLGQGQQLDWGGIAKGYGVDLASCRVRALGVTRGFINAGGDLYCWGRNPEDTQWKIGIKHPRRNGFLGVLAISDLAATTTGDYQRYFIHQGKRYHHVFDPHTGYPAQGKTSVTVVGPEASLCDALSTALFVSPHPEEIIQSFPDYGAIIYDEAGQLSQIGKSFSFQSLIN